MTIYHPFEQEMGGGRLFVHTHSDPYALVTPITRIVRDMSVDQPVERAATLEDVRAEVLTPDRLNALVFGGFAAVALAIAVVRVAGVLVFSVSGRTREFGIRFALGAQPQNLLKGVIAEGAVMAVGDRRGWHTGLCYASYRRKLHPGYPDARPGAGCCVCRCSVGGCSDSIVPADSARGSHRRDVGAAI
jgi:putative ABC transport system permease protein